MTHSPATGERRCVFLDRDGVINVAAAPGDYITTEDQLILIPNVCDWIRLFRVLGFLVIVVTNQRCVARGLVSVEGMERIHRRLRTLLAERGAELDDILYCPHEKDSCSCRKPEPGMVYAAQRKWSISLQGSLLIGDSENDAEMARRCGLDFIRVKQGHIAECVLHQGGVSGTHR